MLYITERIAGVATFMQYHMGDFFAFLSVMWLLALIIIIICRHLFSFLLRGVLSALMLRSRTTKSYKVCLLQTTISSYFTLLNSEALSGFLILLKYLTADRTRQMLCMFAWNLKNYPTLYLVSLCHDISLSQKCSCFTLLKNLNPLYYKEHQ